MLLRTESGLRPTRHPPMIGRPRETRIGRGGRKDFARVVRIFFSRNESPGSSSPSHWEILSREDQSIPKNFYFLDRSRFYGGMLSWAVGLASWNVGDELDDEQLSNCKAIPRRCAGD